MRPNLITFPPNSAPLARFWLRIRLDEVKRRLRQTKDSIAQITADCGWENPTPPKILFRKRFGISMREYRNQSNWQ